MNTQDYISFSTPAGMVTIPRSEAMEIIPVIAEMESIPAPIPTRERQFASGAASLNEDIPQFIPPTITPPPAKKQSMLRNLSPEQQVANKVLNRHSHSFHKKSHFIGPRALSPLSQVGSIETAPETTKSSSSSTLTLGQLIALPLELVLKPHVKKNPPRRPSPLDQFI